MNRCKRNWLFLFLIILLITPIGIYIYRFRCASLSTDTEVWGQFGDYLNGTFMPMIALIGIIITYYLGMISEARNVANIKLDQQKHRPLLHVGYYDKEHEIEVFMVNKGSGPLIITKYKLVNLNDHKICTSVYDILPDNEAIYNNYSGNLDNVVLSSQENFELLKYNPPYAEGLGYSDSAMDDIRKALSNYKIVIDYCDVYNNEMPRYERSFAWFGR